MYNWHSNYCILRNLHIQKHKCLPEAKNWQKNNFLLGSIRCLHFQIVHYWSLLDEILPVMNQIKPECNSPLWIKLRNLDPFSYYGWIFFKFSHILYCHIYIWYPKPECNSPLWIKLNWTFSMKINSCEN